MVTEVLRQSPILGTRLRQVQPVWVMNFIYQKGNKEIMLDQPLVEMWTPTRSEWPELMALVAELDQTDWVAFHADWHLSWHMLVAHLSNKPVGFLYYVTQAIGVEEDQPAVIYQGEPLTEGKVIAFGVAPAHRRKGVGRLLQIRLIAECQRQSCYQIRSHSGAANVENHQLKLSLGFAIHPLVPDQGKDGAYFILPLGRQ